MVFAGRTDGIIVPARVAEGAKPFGWDPIFQPDGSSLTYAEMTSVAKHAISHRARALAKVRDHLLSIKSS